MAPTYDVHDYYKKMLELQEQLRKSEEERIRLEERFKMLVQESRNRHDACINRLRLRYIDFLEEQRKRDERNQTLLGALDRVDSSLSLMTAKTDRLNVLRKQYEAYLLRVYANRGQPGSITGDSGIASHNEERWSRRNIVAGQINPNLLETRNASSPCLPRPSHRSKLDSSSVHNLNQAPHDNANYQIQAPTSGPSIDANHDRFVNMRNQGTPRIGGTIQQQVSSPQISNETRRHVDGSMPKSSSAKFQGDSSLRVQHASPYVLQTGLESLNQRNAGQLDRFPTSQMEEIQVNPRFLTGESTTTEDPSQRRTWSGLQHQPKPLFAQRCLPSPRFEEDPRFSSERYQISPTLRTVPVEPNFLSSRIPDRSMDTARLTGPLPGYLDYSLRTSHETDRQVPGGPLTSSNVDDLLRRNEDALSSGYVRRTPYKGIQRIPELDEKDRTTIVLEDELDRYIGKIKNLHRELDAQSLEELDHEQNTSGDLLNVTLSEDGAELPTETRMKEERLPQEVEKVLALASDLASRTLNVDEKHVGQVDVPGGTPFVDENRSPQSIPTTVKDVPVSGSVMSNTGEERETLVGVDGIRDDVAPPCPELDRHRNDGNLAKQNWNRADDSRIPELRSCESNIFDAAGGDGEAVISSSNATTENDDNGRLSSEADGPVFVDEGNDLRTGRQLELDQRSFIVADHLEPWDIKSMEKEVREMPLGHADAKGFEPQKETIAREITSDDSDRKQSEVSREPSSIERTAAEELGKEQTNSKKDSLMEEDPSKTSLEIEEHAQDKDILDEKSNVEQYKDEILDSNREERDTPAGDGVLKANNVAEERGIDEERKEELSVNEQMSDTSQSHGEAAGIKDEKADDEKERTEYEQNEQYAYEENTAHTSHPNQEYEAYANQEYAEVSAEQYGEYTDQQYNEYTNGTNAKYEQDPNQQYQDDLSQQYEQDPNQQYEQDPNQQYEQDPNQQYEQDPNQQYEQDPNQQYQQDPNQQYEQDPNQQYEQDPNQQYEQDPNQQYVQDPNQQYEQDPNQQYEQDPNQQYQQDPNQQYQQDPNQQYDYSYDQQYVENQTYEGDPNQSYGYTDDAAYNPNQEESIAQEEEIQKQEYDPDAQMPNNDGTAEDAKQTSENQEIVQEMKDKFDVTEGKSGTENVEIGQTKKKDVIKSLLDSDTESTIERNVSNTESDFDFN